MRNLTATNVISDGDMIAVIYHETKVVRFNDKKIILDSGGWKTQTTKLRMNQASAEHNLGYTVFQKKGEWFVYIERDNDVIPFKDKMVLKRK